MEATVADRSDGSLMSAKLARSLRTTSSRSTSDRAASLLKVGDLLASQYCVERLLGEGGMGVVVETSRRRAARRLRARPLPASTAEARSARPPIGMGWASVRGAF